MSDQRPQAPISPYVEKSGFIFTSGQVYLTSEGKLLEGTIQEKTHQVMTNLKNVLEKAGATFSDVVKETVDVTDMSLYADINEVYASYFTDGYPARELVCVKELPLGAKIEISLIAAKD